MNDRAAARCCVVRPPQVIWPSSGYFCILGAAPDTTDIEGQASLYCLANESEVPEGADVVRAPVQAGAHVDVWLRQLQAVPLFVQRHPLRRSLG